MQLSRFFLSIAVLLAPLAILSTTWLYLYPLLHGCTFPVPPTQSHAPFRLLALGDPQLEGDSSLPNPNAPVFPSLEYFVTDITFAKTVRAKWEVLDRARDGVIYDAKRWLEGRRKAVDLWGNDWYLAHIVRQTRWWAQPTHVAVLGDLLGSQWITEGEFEKRARRYWGVVMRGLERVPGSVYGSNYGEVYGENGEKKVQEEMQEMARQMIEDARGAHSWEPEVVESVSEEKLKRDALVDPLEAESHDRIMFEEGGEEGGEVREEASGEVREEGGEQREGETNEQERGEMNERAQEETDDYTQEETDEQKQEDVNKQEQEDTNEHTQEEKNEHTQEETNEHTQEETNEQEQEEEEKPLRRPAWGGTTEVLGANKSWANRVINIAGNHDVGYAGDIDVSRVERFERAFGSVNWDIWFTLPPDTTATDDAPAESSDPPALRIVVLNSMNIDTPAWSYQLQTETYEFMNHIITTSRAVEDKTHATILLTHIPLEKEAGICVDSPYFNFFDEGQGLREQNMLSDHSSKTILGGMFGMSENRWAAGGGLGRRGIVLNGHDHEGCDVVHFIRQEGADDECSADTVKREEAHWPKPTPTPTPSAHPIPLETSPANPLLAHTQISPAPPPEPAPEYTPPGWRAHPFPHRPYSITHNPLTNTSSCTRIDSSPHIREITLRSMMGDFSGHAGFLSGWFDREKGEWTFEFNSCGVGVQHWWWAVHSVDFALVVMMVLAGVSWVVERLTGRGSDERMVEGEKRK
jgi:hypothetical protein